MNFSSNANYKKWLAYGHATGVFERTPGNTPVSINGKHKKVQHNHLAQAENIKKAIMGHRSK